MKSFFETVPRVKEIYHAVYAPAVKRSITQVNRVHHGFVYYRDPDYSFRFSDGTNIVPTPGSVVYLPANTVYTVIPSEKASPHGIYVINFSAEAPVSKPQVITPRSPSTVVSLFEAAERAFRPKKAGYEAKCLSVLYEIIATLTSDVCAKYLPSSKASKIAPAVDFIMENYTKELPSLSQLASLCSISEVYLREIFAEEFGMSPVKYVNALRIERAKELLRSDMQLSIEDVARLSGFLDGCYFRRIFKRETLTSPLEYKRGKQS